MTDAARRKLLTWLLNSSFGALAATVLYPVARFVSPPEIPEADTNLVEAGLSNDPELVEKGFKILRFGNDPVILLRTEADEYRAFAGTCTHLDCIVEFHRTENVIWCNCHNGEYDTQGKVVGGPPPRPLQAFKVDLVDKGPGQPSAIVVSRV
ncbi:MAG: ubiquinol-cytochrome c reductase iron-sulfur subunit [Acidobacteriota bacterium]|nr:ubiquinol-cytochrome c reductase iron-sulfur subunit [Acidobacteriota bacterium]MDH3524559.1 ubiquinol-cytochrome c reductase iron-sulfur subunit [Acidobacteriota bacterium]